MLRKLLKEPLLYAFLLIYVLAAIGMAAYSGSEFAESVSAFVLFGMIFPFFVWMISRKMPVNKIIIREERKEALGVIAYFLVWLLLLMFLGEKILKSMFLSNIIAFWTLLVIVPGIYLLQKGYQWSDLGITKKFLGQNIKFSLIAVTVLMAVLLLITPGGKFLLNNTFEAKDFFKAMLKSFAYAFVFAAFFEEFFFRAILQSRLSAFLKSDLKGLLISSFLFGLYHLPFRFFKAGEAQGDILFALSSVLTEQMLSGLVLGLLWAKTRNLLAPVLLHTLINTLGQLPEMVTSLSNGIS